MSQPQSQGLSQPAPNPTRSSINTCKATDTTLDGRGYKNENQVPAAPPGDGQQHSVGRQEQEECSQEARERGEKQKQGMPKTIPARLNKNSLMRKTEEVIIPDKNKTQE